MRGVLLSLIWIVCLACESRQVEQIDVEVPAGVTVPEGMVYIPAGEFIMGHADDPKTVGGEKVSTGAYFIDRFEVSRERYAAFKQDYSFKPKSGKFPAAHVTYQDAEAYCEWKGGRLPTEAQWEKAARGVDGRKWPWQIYYDHPNNGFSGFIPEPVDKRQEWISPYGVYGMGHNVWEWSRDWYAYPGQPQSDRNKFRVLRGGVTQTHLTVKFTPTYQRNWMEPAASYNFIGFRCTREIEKK